VRITSGFGRTIDGIGMIHDMKNHCIKKCHNRGEILLKLALNSNQSLHRKHYNIAETLLKFVTLISFSKKQLKNVLDNNLLTS
jgi:hypothetical protein